MVYLQFVQYTLCFWFVQGGGGGGGGFLFVCCFQNHLGCSSVHCTHKFILGLLIGGVVGGGIGGGIASAAVGGAFLVTKNQQQQEIRARNQKLYYTELLSRIPRISEYLSKAVGRKTSYLQNSCSWNQTRRHINCCCCYSWTQSTAHE